MQLFVILLFFHAITYAQRDTTTENNPTINTTLSSTVYTTVITNTSTPAACFSRRYNLTCSDHGRCILGYNLTGPIETRFTKKVYQCECNAHYFGYLCNREQRRRQSAFLCELILPFFALGWSYLGYVTYAIIKLVCFMTFGCYAYCFFEAIIGRLPKVKTLEEKKEMKISVARPEVTDSATRQFYDIDALESNRKKEATVVIKTDELNKLQRAILVASRRWYCFAIFAVFYAGLFAWWIIDLVIIMDPSTTDFWGDPLY